jgi:hypothetical protein
MLTLRQEFAPNCGKLAILQPKFRSFSVANRVDSHIIVEKPNGRHEDARKMT